MKRLYTTFRLWLTGILLVAASFMLQAQFNCNNVDFESGNFTNWKGSTGVCCPISTPTNGIVPLRHTIMTGAGNDPIIPQIPVVSPYGGTYSVRLGNTSIGSQAERLTYTFVVDTSNPSFTYQYAVILEDPSHSPAQQPRFQVNVMDSNGNTIPCGFYDVVASANIPGFQRTATDIVWKNWSFVAVDLATYIGQTVTVEFSTGDCQLGGHYGYAYIDASCLPLRIFTNYCPGDPIANLTAPPGFRYYQWSNGETNQIITVTNPTPGDSISVICTPFQGVTCTTKLTYVFLQNPPVDANYSVSTSCGNNQVVFTDSSTISATGAVVTGWKWIYNNAIISTQKTATYSFPSAGTYTISLVAESPYGCPDTIHKNVFIPQGLQVLPVVTGLGLSCANSMDGALKASVNLGVPPYTFTWNTVPVSNSDSVYGLGAGTYTVSVTDSTGCIATASATINAPSAINTTPVVKNVSCFGGNDGRISVSPTGATPPYTYSWNTTPVQTSATASNLPVGSYRVTITDSRQCSATYAATVNQPPALNATIQNKTDNLCFGSATGRATATASGGASPYQFRWNTAPQQTSAIATSLRAGTYNVTVTDDSLCTATASVIINEPSQLTSTSAISHVLCHDSLQGGITITAVNGTAPYSYNWQPPLSNISNPQNLAAGNYLLTVTDNNGCTISGSYSVSEPDALGIQAVPTHVLCSGNADGSVAITGSGGTMPYLYTLLQNGTEIASNSTGQMNNLEVGDYTAMFTDANNCAVSMPVTIIQSTTLNLESITADSVNCFGYNDGAIFISVSGGQPPYQYYLNNAPPTTDGYFTNLAPGNYTITVTEAGGCAIELQTVINEPALHTLDIIPDSVEMLLGESRAVQVVSNYAPNTTYSWSPASGIDCPTCPNPNVGTYNSLEYSIKAIAHPHKKDCEAKIKLPVRVIPNYDIFIPNVFTPNSDGANDFFEYYGNKAAIKYLNVEVFNRIGEKVFESNDVNFRWDGKYKGTYAPGVYVYQFRVTFVDNRTDKLYKGSVTLLK